MRESAEGIPFLKMHGAGNDFVVIDNRSGAYAFDEKTRRLIADRRYGIGCDQIVLLESSSLADVFMRLYNQDGGEVGACGNATRCVAWRVMEETGRRSVKVETRADILHCERAGGMHVTVDMGVPRFDWRSIPLSREVDTTNIPFIRIGMLAEGMALSMGNPHIVFFNKDVDSVPLHTSGPKVEHSELFPERTNVEVAQVLGRDRLKVRVWERGAGETLACGTGACAAMVVARVRGLVDERVTVSLPGGDLVVEWAGGSTADCDRVRMTGPVAVAFEGVWKG